MAKVVQDDGDGNIVFELKSESGNRVDCGDSLRSQLLRGEFDEKLTNLGGIFALAVDDCFDGFDDSFEPDLRVDVLVGLLQKFRLDYAAKSSS